MLINMSIDELKNEYTKSNLISILLTNNLNVIGGVVEYDSYVLVLNPMVIDITLNEENQIIPFLRNFNIASGERFVKINKQQIIAANRISESIKSLYQKYLYDEMTKILGINTPSLNDTIEGMTKQ